MTAAGWCRPCGRAHPGRPECPIDETGAPNPPTVRPRPHNVGLTSEFEFTRVSFPPPTRGTFTGGSNHSHGIWQMTGPASYFPSPSTDPPPSDGPPDDGPSPSPVPAPVRR